MADHPSDRPPADPGRPSTPEADAAPATGTRDPEATHLQPVEEPNTSGTLFFTLFLLMVIFGFWVVMYIELLNR